MAMTTLPKNLLADTGTLREDFETIGDWTVNSGALANDAVNYKVGTQSLQITSTVGGAGTITKTVGPWDFSAFGEMRLWYYTANPTKISQIVLQFADATWTKSLYILLSYRTEAGWSLASLNSGDNWQTVGGMTWATPIRYLRIAVTGVAGQQAVVSFDGFYSHIEATPALMLHFDDGYDDVYNIAFAYMQPRGVPGTAYIITDEIGNAGRLTSAQLLTMQGEGWTIGNHTSDHTDMTTLTQAQCETKLTDAKDALVACGITGNAPYHVAYPGGSYDADVLAAMAATSMLTGRASGGYYFHLPFAEPYKAGVSKVFGNTLSLAQAKTWLDSVISNDELGVALFHTLISGTPSAGTEWNIGDFQAFVNYVVDQGIACINMNTAYLLQSAAQTVTLPSWTPPARRTLSQPTASRQATIYDSGRQYTRPA